MDKPSSMLTDSQKKAARSDFVLLFTTMYNQVRATGRDPSKDTILAELLSNARAQGIHDISRIGRGKLLINGKIFDY